jgi:hypothetical protein
MKKIIALLLFLLAHTLAFSQNDSIAIKVSTKIANALKEALDLTEDQRKSLFAANMKLHEEKNLVRNKYAGSDSLRFCLQQVENKRDSLYHQIITDEEKFSLYADKKRILINAN